MASAIALVGGDEFRPGCESMDRTILAFGGVPSWGTTLLVVPTAAAGQNPARAVDNSVRYFSALGVEAIPLMVLEANHANDGNLLEPIDSAGVIYFTGGDPGHLLDVLRGSALLSKVRQALHRGAVVAGSSAGAMVMGSWMRFGEWREALGIVPGVVVLPHHENSDPESVMKELGQSTPGDVSALGIDARTGCVGDGEVWEVRGAGTVTVYRGGSWQRYVGGASFTLSCTLS